MILLLMLYFTSYFLWYHLIMVVQEDPVLLVPEDERQKPYVAIIKVTDLLFKFVLIKIIILWLSV